MAVEPAGMSVSKNEPKMRPPSVVGPRGEELTLDNLPPPATRRWVVRRKAQVVAAVTGELLTADEACERYGLSMEEFVGWRRAIERVGLAALRVTRTQEYAALFRGQQGGSAW